MNENDEILQKLLKSIEESNKKQTEELKEHINNEVHDLKQTINKQAKTIKILENNYNELKIKYQKLEKSLRKNNIIIFDLEFKEGNLLEYTLIELNKYLKLQLVERDINNIYTIGKKTENRPIIVQFATNLKKQVVLKNCFNLKNTNIKISEELNLEERQERKILVQHLKEARQKGLITHIKGNKLYINGEGYTAKELTESDYESEIEGEGGKETDNYQNCEKREETITNDTLDTGGGKGSRRVNSVVSKKLETGKIVRKYSEKDNELEEKEDLGNTSKKRKVINSSSVTRSSARNLV